MYRGDIINARRTAKDNLALMGANLGVFNRIKNGENYIKKVKQLLEQREELTAKQCSYVNEVIYEKFMQGLTNEGCPSTYRHTRKRNFF